jgi:hypothetical protein
MNELRVVCSRKSTEGVCVTMWTPHAPPRLFPLGRGQGAMRQT